MFRLEHLAACSVSLLNHQELVQRSFPLSRPGGRFLSKIGLWRSGHRVDGHGVTETFERLVSECAHFERLPLKRPRELFVRYDAPRGCDLHEARRKVLDRELVRVETAYGAVRVKVARRNGRVVNVAPEYEDCQRVAAEKAVPLKEVMLAAQLAYSTQAIGPELKSPLR